MILQGGKTAALYCICRETLEGQYWREGYRGLLFDSPYSIDFVMNLQSIISLLAVSVTMQFFSFIGREIEFMKMNYSCQLQCKFLMVCLILQWLYGSWFYRPEDTSHISTRKFLEKVTYVQKCGKGNGKVGKNMPRGFTIIKE